MDLIEAEPRVQVHLLGNHLNSRRLAKVVLRAGE